MPIRFCNAIVLFTLYPFRVLQVISGYASMTQESYNVLFLCTGNSARSIIAEAVLDLRGRGKFNAYSAGSQPKGEIHPLARWILNANNYQTDRFSSKSLDEFTAEAAPKMDFVFTVCDHAAEQCPIFPGQPMTAHWGLPDPAAVAGTEIEQKTAFQQTFMALDRRLSIFVNLPFESLDKLKLQVQLDEIATAADRPNGETAGV